MRPSGGRPIERSDLTSRPLSIDEAHDPPGIGILKLDWEEGIGPVLVANRSDETIDSASAHAGVVAVGRRGVGPPVMDTVTDLQPHRETVENEAPGLLLKE